MTLVKVNNQFSKTFDGMMKELFNEFPAAVNKTVREDVLHFPPVNIIEKAATYQLEVAAAGFVKADFNVKLESNILTISTEKKETANEETDKLIRKEFSHKSSTTPRAHGRSSSDPRASSARPRSRGATRSGGARS